MIITETSRLLMNNAKYLYKIGNKLYHLSASLNPQGSLLLLVRSERGSCISCANYSRAAAQVFHTSSPSRRYYRKCLIHCCDASCRP